MGIVKRYVPYSRGGASVDFRSKSNRPRASPREGAAPLFHRSCIRGGIETTLWVPPPRLAAPSREESSPVVSTKSNVLVGGRAAQA